MLLEITLTQKLIVLLLLLAADRFSTIKQFSINNMVVNDLPVTFLSTEVLKYSRKRKPPGKFGYKVYEDNTLCIIICLKEYVSRKSKHDGLTIFQLIITLRKSFKGASIIATRR